MQPIVLTAIASLLVGLALGGFVATRVFRRVVAAYDASTAVVLEDASGQLARAHGQLARRKKSGRRRGMTVRRLRKPRQRAPTAIKPPPGVTAVLPGDGCAAREPSARY